MLPDIVGGLIDTPIDPIVMSMQIYYRRLSAKDFGFSLSEFPIARPAFWEGEAEDETERNPMQMLWRKRRAYGSEESTVERESAFLKEKWASKSHYDRKTDRGKGTDENENVLSFEVRYSVESVADPRDKISRRWWYEDGEYFYAQNVPTYSSDEDEYTYESDTFAKDDAPKGIAHFWDWNPFNDLVRSFIVTPDVDTYGEAWDESAPTLTRDIERNGQTINSTDRSGNRADVTINQTIALRWGLSEKYSTQSLYEAIEKMIDTAPEQSAKTKPTIKTPIAGFCGSTWDMPEELAKLDFIASRFAPLLDQKFDDGSFHVERVAEWVGCADDWRSRVRYDHTSRLYVRFPYPHYKWIYDGNITPNKVIEPFIDAKPNGLGVLSIFDILFGAMRKLTEGNK